MAINKMGFKNDVDVFVNSVPDNYFQIFVPEKKYKGLKKLLIVSNHIPKELVEAVQVIKSHQVKVEVIGLGNKYQLVTADLLADYDAVVTIGRTVQHALATGMPVYCYDQFGGPGWIKCNNVIDAEFYNFSGRCTRRALDPVSLASEILDGYSDAFQDREELYRLARERYQLRKNINQVLEKIKIVENVPMDAISKFSILNRYNLYYLREYNSKR